MRVVDTKGQLCPAPLIATKRALKETVSGESIIVITDNITSFNNLSRFLRDNNTEFNFVEDAGVWTLTITRSSGAFLSARVEEYCAPEITHFEKGDFIIVISSDKMGEGDDELGLLLMANFIKAIKDLERLPKKIVFYNRGVTLVTNESSVINDMKDIEKMGVELLLCATCVNHLKIESNVGAGTVSNIYTIAEVMVSATKIIKP